jgi:hypothetical protein
MNEDKNAVETQVEPAVIPQEVDYEAVLKAKDEELAKVKEEKENYKKGLLKAKGKLPEDYQTDTDEPEDAESLTRRIVQETLLSTKEAQLQVEKDQALAAVLKRNKELELALKNRGQITSTSAEGSNQDKPEVNTDKYFSNEQIKALKAKGYDDKKIDILKKNMQKVSQMPTI